MHRRLSPVKGHVGLKLSNTANREIAWRFQGFLFVSEVWGTRHGVS